MVSRLVFSSVGQLTQEYEKGLCFCFFLERWTIVLFINRGSLRLVASRYYC